MGLRLQPAWEVLLSSPRRCWGRGEGAAGCSGHKLDLKGPTLHPPPAGAQARPCSPSPATPHHRCPRLLEQVPTTFVLLQPLGFSSGPLSLTVK